MLPVSIDSAMGYHMKCYRRFVSLSEVQRGKMEEAEKLEGQSNANYEVSYKISRTITKHRSLPKGLLIL